MFEGRTREQKKEIIEKVKKVFLDMGIKKEQIIIVLNENPKENFYFPNKG